VLSSITGNIFTIIGGSLIYFVIRLLQRRGRLRFFGIDQSTSEITIYLSRLRVKPGGTEGYVDLKRGYVGPAITAVEYQAALEIRELLYGRLILIPRRVQEFLGNRFLALKPIDPRIVMSPAMSEQNTLVDREIHEARVLLGSEAYNSLTKHYVTDSKACEACDFQMKEIPVEVGEGEKERAFLFRKTAGTVRGPSRQREVAVLQRFRDHHDRQVIVCAGLGSGGTAGCARYLADHWKTLQREVGDRVFTKWLTFEPNLDNPDGIEEIPQPNSIFGESQAKELATPPKG
jgi:hypothetical protein